MTQAELHTHFADEHGRRLDEAFRRAFPRLCLLYLVLGGLTLLHWYLAIFSDPEIVEATRFRHWARLAGLLGAIGVVLWEYLVHRRTLRTRQQTTAATMVMILLVGVILLVSRLVLQKVLPHYGAWGIVDLFALHLIACLTIPWTPQQSIWPFVPLMLLWIGIVAFSPSDLDLDRAVACIAGTLVLVPGAAVAAWRAKRSAEDIERVLLGQQVRSMGGELSRARIVHDAMFPAPIEQGPVRFDYDYQPIAEIGGDYVHLHCCGETGRVSMTLLDVAGHGLAAALTVNRLFGEMERIRAEHPDAGPPEVMTLLNRYINLTMSHHDLYATGTCIMLDPNTGELEWVSAGHPPAFLRRADGTVTDLDSTAIILGALGDAEWDPAPQRLTVRPGDVVIAYTDGAFEARDREGRQFGLDALRETTRFSPPPRSWTRFIASAVVKHHEGFAEDDVLIATLQLASLQFTRAAGRGAAVRPGAEAAAERVEAAGARA